MATICAKTWRAAKRAANDFLHEVGRTYHESIPLSAIVARLAGLGIAVPDSECLLCGRDSRATFALTMDGADLNSVLVLMWHRMESGRYEVTAYLS